MAGFPLTIHSEKLPSFPDIMDKYRSFAKFDGLAQVRGPMGETYCYTELPALKRKLVCVDTTLCWKKDCELED